MTFGNFDRYCVGEYTIETYTIGACSSGGVKYQIVGTVSPVPSLAPTAALSGYYVTARYSEDRCTKITSAVSYPLNSCNNDADGLGGYVKYTATASTIARTEYSDLSCTTAVSTPLPIYIDYSATCKSILSYMYVPSNTLISINSNGVPPSSLTMASIRLVHIISLSCVMASFQSQFTFSFLHLLTVSDLTLHHSSITTTPISISSHRL